MKKKFGYYICNILCIVVVWLNRKPQTYISHFVSENFIPYLEKNIIKNCKIIEYVIMIDILRF